MNMQTKYARMIEGYLPDALQVIYFGEGYPVIKETSRRVFLAL